MPNGTGLAGSGSSTQSSIILKKPGLNPNYLIFTVDNVGGKNGLRYSEVDMGMNNGLGDVNYKNILLVTPTCEKLAAINHRNGTSYWIVTRLYLSDVYHSYLLTSTGLDTVPVISAGGGLSTANDSLATLGYLKASKSGEKLASVFTYLNKVEVFDFDNAVGKLTNPKTLLFGNNENPYGAEFSTNERFLYTCNLRQAPLVQFDLTKSTSSAINNSKITLGSYFENAG